MNRFLRVFLVMVSVVCQGQSLVLEHSPMNKEGAVLGLINDLFMATGSDAQIKKELKRKSIAVVEEQEEPKFTQALLSLAKQYVVKDLIQSVHVFVVGDEEYIQKHTLEKTSNLKLKSFLRKDTPNTLHVLLKTHQGEFLFCKVGGKSLLVTTSNTSLAKDSIKQLELAAHGSKALHSTL